MSEISDRLRKDGAAVVCDTCKGIAHPPLDAELGGCTCPPKPSRREMMEKILDVWESLPELRLGQLLMNAGLRNGADDLYYLEDEALVQRLQEYMRKHFYG